jgi:hypothetical protein
MQTDLFQKPRAVHQWTDSERHFIDYMDTVYDTHCEQCRCHDLCLPVIPEAWKGLVCGEVLLLTWRQDDT